MTTKFPGEVLTQIIINFAPQFSAAFLAGWMLLIIKKRGKKRACINRKDIALKKNNILRLVQEEITKYDKQKSKRKNKK